MADKNKAIQDQIDALIKELKDNPDLSDEIEVEVNKLQIQLDAKKDNEDKKGLYDKLSELHTAISDTKIQNSDKIDGIVEAIGKIELPTPQVTVQPPEVTVNVPEIKVPETKIPTINVPKPQVNFPEAFSIKRPTWLPKIDLSPITRAIDKLIGAIPQVKWPTAAKDAIAVRLSDGEKFYKALGGLAASVAQGFPFKTSDGEQAAPLVGDDGILKVSGTMTIDTITGAVEITNDAGNPIPVSGTFYQATQPVSAASLPLPSGAATSANQSTANTSLNNIDQNTNGIETLLVAIASYTDGLEDNTAALALESGGNLASIKTNTDKIPALGQALAAASVPVVLTAAQLSTLTPLSTIAVTQSGTWDEVGINDSGNSITVDYATTGSGTATGALRVELPTNGTGVIATVGAVTAITNALPAGSNAIGKLAANSGVDIGDVDVTSAVSATIDHGSNLDIDTSAEQITSTSFACKFGVTIKADITNTGIVYIGNSDVTASGTAATDGFPLSAGESLTLEVTNSNIPYAIASSNNQKVYWVAV